MALLEWLRGQGNIVEAHDCQSVGSDERADMCDMMLFYAIGGRQGIIKEDALNKGIDCIVLEFGFMDRMNHLGVSLLDSDHRIHNNNGDFLMMAKSPLDRLEKLGVEVTESPVRAPAPKRRGRKPKNAPVAPQGTDKVAIVLGQVDGDSQLGGINLADWTKDTMKTLEMVGYRVEYRPHPGIQRSMETLEDAVQRADLVAAYNSTALVEAVRVGVPFICSDLCQYFGMSTKNIAAPTAKPIEERRQFMANLAYCQYDAEEFGDGTAWRHIENLAQLREVEIANARSD